MSSRWKGPLQRVALLTVLLGLTYAYLYPGSQALLEKRTDLVLSDDTDPMTLPYAYDSILQVWQQKPSRFWYGTVYVDGTNPERGVAHWMPWNERWLVLLHSHFFPVEQLSTALVFTLLLLNALCMYALARFLKWERSIAFGLSLAWAFCAYTRARAKVHMAMAGTYHLPLIFLALFLVVRGKTWRSTSAGAALLLVAMTVVHYYIVTMVFLTPLFLLFLAMQPETRQNWRRIAGRTAMAVIPVGLFLAWNFLVSVPPDARMSQADSRPHGGDTNNGEAHAFMYYFAAHPIDYLGGDISLNYDPSDLNPLQTWVNRSILGNLGMSNGHERTNGIRWPLLALALAALFFLARGRLAKSDLPIRRNVIFFFIFAAFTFWLSLEPDVPWPGWGPSYWLHALVAQIRVPSRAGLNVNFAILMIAGFFLASRPRWLNFLFRPGVFPALIVLAYPPFYQNMPMAPIRPAYAELQREKGACGVGMYFPFVNFYQEQTLYYQFVQRLRGSDCPSLNNMSTPARLALMIKNFPPTAQYLNQLPIEEANRRMPAQAGSPPFDNTSAARLEHLANCVPLTWIAFDPNTPKDWMMNTCHRLGWTLYPDLTCISPVKGTPLRKFPDECG